MALGPSYYNIILASTYLFLTFSQLLLQHCLLSLKLQCPSLDILQNMFCLLLSLNYTFLQLVVELLYLCFPDCLLVGHEPSSRCVKDVDLLHFNLTLQSLEPATVR